MKNILLGFLAALGAALGSAIIQTFFDSMNVLCTRLRSRGILPYSRG
jgi:hypothetical protein